MSRLRVEHAPGEQIELKVLIPHTLKRLRVKGPLLKDRGMGASGLRAIVGS